MWVPEAESMAQQWHGEASWLWNPPQMDRQLLGCDLWREEEHSWWQPGDPGQLPRKLQTSTDLQSTTSAAFCLCKLPLSHCK